MQGDCPSPTELNEAFSESDATEVREHVQQCPSCRQAWQEMEQVVDLARDLAALPQTQEAQSEQRARLLELARPRTARKRWVTTVAALVAAAGLAGLVLVRVIGQRDDVSIPSSPPKEVSATVRTRPAPSQQREVRHGRVRAVGAADFLHIGQPGDEIVRLHSGTLLAEVSPLTDGARFRILTGDSEVEVRGTTFEVAASADRLERVSVIEGEVHVHHNDRLTILSSGQQWPLPRAGVDNVHRSPAVTSRPVARKRLPAPPAAPAAAATRAEISDVIPPWELAFDRAWRAFRQGDLEAAVLGFAQSVRQQPHSPVAPDARFWLAVSHQRLGHASEARAAFKRFLAHHPSAARAGEASVALGWLLLEVGEPVLARPHFVRARNDPSPAVARSAKRGLDALRDHSSAKKIE